VSRPVDEYPWRLRETPSGEIYSTNRILVGNLGRISYSEAKAHEAAGVRTHQWRFVGNYGSRSGGLEIEQRCEVCGRERRISEKGHTIRRNPGDAVMRIWIHNDRDWEQGDVGLLVRHGPYYYLRREQPQIWHFTGMYPAGGPKELLGHARVVEVGLYDRARVALERPYAAPVRLDDDWHPNPLDIDWGVVEFTPADLDRGIAVELEHGTVDPRTNVTDDDLELTAKIALAHLYELPDYYERLAVMEENPGEPVLLDMAPSPEDAARRLEEDWGWRRVAKRAPAIVGVQLRPRPDPVTGEFVVERYMGVLVDGRLVAAYAQLPGDRIRVARIPYAERDQLLVENPPADYLAELAATGYGELKDYYPQTAADEMDTRFPENLYYGRNVIWDGYEGRMVRVSAEQLHPIQGNIFDENKLAAVRDGILHASDRLVFTAPYGDADLIDEDDIRESIEYEEGEILTTGDKGLDRWIVDGEQYLYDEGFDPEAAPEAWDKAEAEMEGQLEHAVEQGWGDLGSFTFQIRDGNHRAFGALAAGEPYIWMLISKNQMLDVDDPEMQHPSIVALREIIR
jgi:Protein of unknown function (DUF5661)